MGIGALLWRESKVKENNEIEKAIESKCILFFIRWEGKRKGKIKVEERNRKLVNVDGLLAPSNKTFSFSLPTKDSNQLKLSNKILKERKN